MANGLLFDASRVVNQGRCVLGSLTLKWDGYRVQVFDGSRWGFLRVWCLKRMTVGRVDYEERGTNRSFGSGSTGVWTWMFRFCSLYKALLHFVVCTNVQSSLQGLLIMLLVSAVFHVMTEKQTLLEMFLENQRI